MKRSLLLAVLLAAACGGSGSSANLAPAFSLLDVNTGSPTGGQDVSPRDYVGSVSAWYFADATSIYSADQFGLLDKMQQELFIEQRTAGAIAIQIVAVNKIGSEAGSLGMTLGRTLPCVQDTAAADVEMSWGASDGDLVILDDRNVPVDTYSLMTNDLADPAVYEAVKTLLRGGPAEQAPDFLLLDVNPNSPTANMDVSPRDYIGRISGYYFGAAT
jgi:hypothetical protein